MNRNVAKEKSINEGDSVQLTSEGGMVIGIVKLTEGIHPEVLGISGNFGAQSEGRPIARGTGVHFNTLVPTTMDRIDPITGGLDSCVRASITKVN